MDYERIATIVLAAAAILIAYAVVWSILRGWVFSALVVLPLALSLPWDKRFPATSDALAHFTSIALLAAWLYARSSRPHAVRNSLIAAVAILIVKQDMLVLVLAAIVLEAWRMRKAVKPSETIGVMAAMIFFTGLSTVIVRPIDPADAVQGLLHDIAAGTAWDGTNWIFTGTDIRASIKSASTFGRTFFLPLLIPFAVMLYTRRREWWVAPMAAWCALILIFTAVFARWPIFRACPPLAGALGITTGVAGVELLRDQLPWLRGGRPQATPREG